MVSLVIVWYIIDKNFRYFHAWSCLLVQLSVSAVNGLSLCFSLVRVLLVSYEEELSWSSLTRGWVWLQGSIKGKWEGLERWLPCYKHLLFFQRTRVQFPAPLSQPTITLTPDLDLMLFSGSVGHQACMWCTLMHADTCTYIFIKNKLNKLNIFQRIWSMFSSLNIWRQIAQCWQFHYHRYTVMELS